MKAILRDYNGEHFVVKEIERNPDGSYTVDENRKVKETNILTIIDNEKCKRVVCSHCGEIMPNTKRVIENHRNAHKTHEGCMKCSNLKYNPNNMFNVKYSLNEDGTFTRSLKDSGTLVCNNGYYRHHNITGESWNKDCKYKGCADAKFDPLTTFFDKYAGAFDDMITVDAIDGFKDVYDSGGYTRIQLKARGNIFAYVNKKGIVEWFRVNTRYDIQDLFYSKKYDKFFKKEMSDKYSEVTRCPLWSVSSDRWEYIKGVIRKLYN